MNAGVDPNKNPSEVTEIVKEIEATLILVLTKEITFRAYRLMLLMGYSMKLKLLKNH